MKAMVSKAFLKAVCFSGCVMLTLFAGLFALASISCLVVSVIEKDILSVILSAFCGFVAWMIWPIRKDTLV